MGGSVRNHHTKRLFDRTRNRPWGTSTRKANDPDARAGTRLEQTPAPPAWKPSFTDLTKTCVGRMVGLTAITVGLRPRYVTIFIVMDVAAGRRAVNKYVHSLGVAPPPRLRRLPCVLLTHINHWDAWERCGKVVGKDIFYFVFVSIPSGTSPMCAVCSHWHHCAARSRPFCSYAREAPNLSSTQC